MTEKTEHKWLAASCWFSLWRENFSLFLQHIIVYFNCCCGHTSSVHGYSSKINQVDLICKWQRSLSNFCGHIIFRWTHKVQFVLHLFFYHMLHVTSMRILYASFFIFFYPLSLQHYCSLRWYVSGQISWWHTNFLIAKFLIIFCQIKLVEEVVMSSFSKVYLFFLFYYIELCVWMSFPKCSSKTVRALGVF